MAAPTGRGLPRYPNRAKARLAAGEVVIAVGGVNDPETVDFIGQAGFDAVWIEAEHGPIDFSDIGDMTRACDVWGMTSLVRVGRTEPNTIYRTLDRGAHGLVVPHVTTKQQAELIVDSAKFAPIGHRGMWRSRHSYGDPDFHKRANRETMIVILIEDVAGIENLDELLEVEHIDVYQIAFSDLTQSMGHTDTNHPEVQEVLDESLARIVAAGKNAGVVATAQNVQKYIHAGVRFFFAWLPDWVLAGAAEYRRAVTEAIR